MPKVTLLARKPRFLNPKSQERGREMDGEVRNRRSKRKEREGGEGARNEPLLLLVTEIWGLFITAADLSLS